MSNYRAQCSQNLSQTTFKFTILIFEDTLYLNIKDLILRSYFNTFTHVNIKQSGELTWEESNVSWRRPIFKLAVNKSQRQNKCFVLSRL